jgi:hypothetical protein
MVVDSQKLETMLRKPAKGDDPKALSREADVFFVGCTLPVKETLETIFDSYCQAPAGLFKLYFDHHDNYRQGEMIARQIKKNFTSHLMGRFDYSPAVGVMESAYVAGVDIIDIPLWNLGYGDPGEGGITLDDRLRSLRNAKSIFPRWSVMATLPAAWHSPVSLKAMIDLLLDKGVVPLVEISSRSLPERETELTSVYVHLAEGWRRHKVTMNPIQPLIDLLTPLVPARQKGYLMGLVDKLHGRQILAVSDLRRSLRVRQVEESFESAGL